MSPFMSLLCTSWWTIISAPWSAHIYRVEDPKTRKQALENIKKTWLKNHFPFRFFNYIMLMIDIVGLLVVLLFFIYVVSFLFR